MGEEAVPRRKLEVKKDQLTVENWNEIGIAKDINIRRKAVVKAERETAKGQSKCWSIISC